MKRRGEIYENTPPHYYVWLSELCGAGSKLPKAVYEVFGGNLRHAYEADLDEYISMGFSEDEAELLNDKDFSFANRTVDYCIDNRVGILHFGSEYYPQKLYETENPPPVLYYKGRIDRLSDGAYITAVGSRVCSEDAYEAGYSFCYRLACSGISVISGAADGIDTACTCGALDAGGFAVAVLGSGINILYPFDNSALFSRLFKTGLVITEFSPFTEPRGANFPIRNRIMAALGDAALVVEAREQSGSLITAQFARDMGKRIYVVPGSVANPLCAGSNELIRSGATAVTDASDIISEFEFSYPDAVSLPRFRSSRNDGNMPLRKHRRLLPRRAKAKSVSKKTDDFRENLCDETVQPELKPARNLTAEELASLSDTEKAIYLELKNAETPLSSDDLGKKLGLLQEEILASLTMLEIYGFIQSLAGGLYASV